MAGIDNKSINGKGLAAMYDEHMQTVVTPMLQRMNGIEGRTLRQQLPPFHIRLVVKP